MYADVKSLEEAMQRNSAPFYLRRTKEALVTFPDPDTGKIKKLFTKRIVRTAPFQIDSDEWDLYDALTRYVEDQSIKAQTANATTGRAIGFTMAMLQRRLASSIYAARRSLERMRDKRQKILDDPQAYRQEQMEKKLPEDFDDLTDEEQHQIMSELEAVVASVDPAALREEIIQLSRLIDQAPRSRATRGSKPSWSSFARSFPARACSRTRPPSCSCSPSTRTPWTISPTS